MRITFATVGSRGDIQPMIALAMKARARGHAPLVCGPPNFRSWVESHGIAFAPLGSDIQAWLGENSQYLSGNPVTMLKGMSKYFSEQLPMQFEQLLTAAKGTDAIVMAGLAFASVSIGEHLGVPVLAVAYSPTVLPGRAHPPPMVPWQRMPAWLNDLIWRAQGLAGDRLVGHALNEGRRSIGLPPVDAITHLYGQVPFLVAADEQIFPRDASWRDAYGYANFIFYDDPGRLPAELDDWLAAGDPPVFVGFGSMSGSGTERIERLLVDALGRLGKRVLLGAGWGGLGGGALPDGWRVVKEAPHALLFPRTAAVIHHGGSGTTANALRAGVPQVLLPLILDQFHHAHRLHEAQLAPKPTPMESVTATELAQAVEAALALPEGPRRAAAERLRASDGAGMIVDRVEQLAAARAA